MNGACPRTDLLTLISHKKILQPIPLFRV